MCLQFADAALHVPALEPVVPRLENPSNPNCTGGTGHDVNAACIGDQLKVHEPTKDEDLPMPAHQLVRVIHALTEGLVFQRPLTPELMPDEIFRAAFAAIGKKAKRLPQ
jgi:hypothetical protein